MLSACSPDGSVRITVPRWGSRRDAELFAEQQRPWIEHQRAAWPASSPHVDSAYTPEAIKELRRQAAANCPPLACGSLTIMASGFARQCTQSAVAMGIVLAVGTYLSELAARADARRRA